MRSSCVRRVLGVGDDIKSRVACQSVIAGGVVTAPSRENAASTSRDHIRRVSDNGVDVSTWTSDHHVETLTLQRDQLSSSAPPSQRRQLAAFFLFSFRRVVRGFSSAAPRGPARREAKPVDRGRFSTPPRHAAPSPLRGPVGIPTAGAHGVIGVAMAVRVRGCTQARPPGCSTLYTIAPEAVMVTPAPVDRSAQRLCAGGRRRWCFNSRISQNS